MTIKETFSDLLETDVKQGNKLQMLHSHFKKLETEKDEVKRKALAKEIEALEKDCMKFSPKKVLNMRESLNERTLEPKGVFARAVGSSEKLKGKAYAITGPLTKATREEYKHIIEKHGGEYHPMVSDKTHYLITNNTKSGSRKNLAAQKHGTKVMNEKGFLKHIK